MIFKVQPVCSKDIPKSKCPGQHKVGGDDWLLERLTSVPRDIYLLAYLSVTNQSCSLLETQHLSSITILYMLSVDQAFMKA